jgi:hypothetical protein
VSVVVCVGISDIVAVEGVLECVALCVGSEVRICAESGSGVSGTVLG